MAAQVTQDMLLRMISDISSMSQGINQIAGQFNQLDNATQKLGKGFSFVNQSLSVFTGNLMAMATQQIAKGFSIITQGFDRFVNLAKDATMQSARIEVQWRTLSLTAGNAGQSIEDMSKHVQALRAAGIKTSEALESVTQFLATGLPVDSISDLARRAQDMAVVIGRDSTEAFQRFNNFLQTGNSEWIRTMGITKTATQMMEEYARAQGTTAKALDDRQRKEALVQGLMQATVGYMGAYEEALKDPYKRWTSLPRLISNVVEVLGAMFVPMMGTIVDVISDALEKIERLFRVTKKEAKETGRTIGEWKEGFLKVRAVVTAFANWFMSIWKRLTGGFNEATESMMDRFVNAIVNGVKAAADAFRKFATFIASIFGGRAPGEITAGAIAATKPAPGKAAQKRVAPPAGPPVEVPVTPGAAEKVRAKPVAAPTAEDIAQYSKMSGQWAAMTAKLAQATAAATKAREGLAKAEDAVEKASEKVYDIRRKIQRLELEWAEVPERFIRGRKRQLQIELQAAEHEEHERQKAVEGERDRLKLAEDYEKQVSSAADKLKRDMDKLGDSISKQAEKYGEWLGKLQEASEVKLVEPVQQVVNELETLDDLTAVYLGEIEGELMPAFASIEESALALADNLGLAFQKAKDFVTIDVVNWATSWWQALQPVREFFSWLWDTIRKIIEDLGGLPAIFEKLKPVLEVVSTAGVGKGTGAIKEALMGDKQMQAVVGGALTAGILPALQALGITDWVEDSVIGPMIDTMRGSEKDIEDTADKTLADPLISAGERASREMVGASIIPDLIASILDWFRRLADDVNIPLDDFVDTAISHFDDLAESWQLQIEDITLSLDQLTQKFLILTDAILGIPTLPEGLQLAADGNVRIVNIDMRGSTFGGGATEGDMQDMIHDVFSDLMRE